MNIVTIIGARPQFIKAAVLSREIKKNEQIHEKIIHTGQHFDINMSDIFFEQLEIPAPDYNLNINGLNHGAMTGQMMEKIEQVLITEKPDYVLVYGDTNSTLAGALAAKKLHIKVAHVEAGLRSFNMQMPEEINRILTDRISDILFCPTEQAIKNLQQEGFENFDIRIVNCGDVMQDAALFYTPKAVKPKDIKFNQFYLCTIHRAENTDDLNQLRILFETLLAISKSVPIVLPLHPRTRSKLVNLGFDFIRSNIQFLDPVGYLEMVWLLQNCQMVMTDSGGLQKESYFFKKPCLTLRNETEWVELVLKGFNIITGNDQAKIHAAIDYFTTKSLDFDIDLYGNGQACGRILKELLK